MTNTQLEAFGNPFQSEASIQRFLNEDYRCPFDRRIDKCNKPNRGEIRYGSCSAKVGDYKRIICPRRFYEDNYKILRDVKDFIFGDISQVDVYPELRLRIQSPSGDRFDYGSLDWLLVSRDNNIDFVGIEVQADATTGTGKFKEAIQDLLNDRLREHYNFGLNTLASFKGFLPQFIFKGQLFDEWKKPYVAIMQDELWESFISKFRIRYKEIDEFTSETFIFFTYSLTYNSEMDKYELVLDNIYKSRWIDLLYSFAVEEDLLIDFSRVKETIERRMSRQEPFLTL